MHFNLIIKWIWITAFCFSSLALTISLVGSFILWRIGPRDRLKYILPMIPFILALVIRSFLAVVL